jgi:hypothetical protein
MSKSTRDAGVHMGGTRAYLRRVGRRCGETRLCCEVGAWMHDHTNKRCLGPAFRIYCGVVLSKLGFERGQVAYQRIKMRHHPCRGWCAHAAAFEKRVAAKPSWPPRTRHVALRLHFKKVIFPPHNDTTQVNVFEARRGPTVGTSFDGPEATYAREFWVRLISFPHKIVIYPGVRAKPI